jgi:hypothetical protein
MPLISAVEVLHGPIGRNRQPEATAAMRVEARPARYIDGFVLRFQNRENAQRL